MLADYASKDPHLALAKAFGSVPADATKYSHRAERERWKTVNLGVLYGMTYRGLAIRLGISEREAKRLLAFHQNRYPRFWAWRERIVARAYDRGRITAIFGWQARVVAGASERTLMNFLMQSDGAEMMRVAAIAATEACIPVVAPVHDAFLVCAPIDQLDRVRAEMSEIMGKAARAVCGIDVRVDVKTWTYPDRYMTEDEDGREMWNRVMRLLDEGREALETPAIPQAPRIPAIPEAPRIPETPGIPEAPAVPS